MFGKHHLAIDRMDWESGALSGEFGNACENLTIEDIKPTWENFKPLISKIKTGVKWADLYRYRKDQITPVLAQEETRLLLLKSNDRAIGYSLIVGIKPDLKHRFWKSVTDKSVIEIENLALFEKERGNGVGKLFFAMILDDLFVKYDTIYWGTSDFNANSLVSFYENEIGMTILDYDEPKLIHPNAQIA